MQLLVVLRVIYNSQDSHLGLKYIQNCHHLIQIQNRSWGLHCTTTNILCSNIPQYQKPYHPVCLSWKSKSKQALKYQTLRDNNFFDKPRSPTKSAVSDGKSLTVYLLKQMFCFSPSSLHLRRLVNNAGEFSYWYCRNLSFQLGVTFPESRYLSSRQIRNVQPFFATTFTEFRCPKKSNFPKCMQRQSGHTGRCHAKNVGGGRIVGRKNDFFFWSATH